MYSNPYSVMIVNKNRKDLLAALMLRADMRKKVDGM